VGFELWVVNSGSIFSQVLITDSFDEAKAVADKTFTPFVEAEKEAKKAFDEKNKPAEPAKPDAADSDAAAAGEEDDDHEEL